MQPSHSFFEGPEKKFELILKPSAPSLRSLGASLWQTIVRAANADILSTMNSPLFDAYLLSESSLFVYDRHVTMITCGRTRLVDAALLALNEIPCLGDDLENLSLLVYERKNEHFPNLQDSNFLDDARVLGQRLGERLGKPAETQLDIRALRFGVEHAHRIDMLTAAADHTPTPDDVTLEVLMHGIDPLRAAGFYSGPRAQRSAARLGLDGLLGPALPTTIDEHAFDPAGYSVNAVTGGNYYTIHVTPEAVGSYASFETNWDFRPDPWPLIERVVGRFEPESFDVLTFVPRADGSRSSGSESTSRNGEFPPKSDLPYVSRKRVDGDVAGYAVSFSSFFRPLGTERPTPLPLG